MILKGQAIRFFFFFKSTEDAANIPFPTAVNALKPMSKQHYSQFSCHSEELETLGLQVVNMEKCPQSFPIGGA